MKIKKEDTIGGMLIGLCLGFYLCSSGRSSPNLHAKTGDFNADGRQDIALYVGVESKPRYVFLQQEDGTFKGVHEIMDASANGSFGCEPK